MTRSMWREAAVIAQRDPAARSTLEVALTYPGLHAVWGHRLAHRLYRRGWFLAARVVSATLARATGVDIHPGAVIGPRLFIDHATGVVIGETCVIGEDVTLYQGVTLGGTSLERSRRHPTIGDRVVIGAGAKVLGPITVGADSRIGANAVVVRDVPRDSIVVGVPGRAVLRDSTVFRAAESGEDSPDLVARAVASLSRRLAVIEAHVGRPSHEAHGAMDAFGGDDFSI
jgi:serine O-acetyltransferase